MGTLELQHKHLLEIGSLDVRALRTLVDRARELGRDAHEPTLRGRRVCTMFFEDSTRTRVSFETAARRSGAEVMPFETRASSVSKGETLLDTAQTVIAIGAECLVLRHAVSGAARWLASHLERAGTAVPVLNAGDGMHEHPTQALLDVMTLESRLGDLSGRTVAIIGDVKHSRVARSLARLLHLFGAEARLIGPRAFVPQALGRALGASVSHDPIAGTRGVDAVYFLRIQSERQQRVGYLPTSAYRALYAGSRPSVIPDEALIMHPGPVNRGVELDETTLNDPRCVVTEQVANGVLIRMAALERALIDGWGTS